MLSLFCRKRYLAGSGKISRLSWALPGLLLLTVLWPASGFAQQRPITGNVTTSANLPLSDVTVSVENTAKATVTDAAGNYNISVTPADLVLVFSHVGYASVRKEITGLSSLNVVLTTGQPTLDSVVVVGFGVQKKLSVTGAVSDVPVRNLERISTPSLSNALGGSMAGIVTRQASGEPGADQAQIFIRGMATWGNRSPLILVDGIERDINNINTQEIATLSILKDASATAVFGVRGANGVIQITTKRGAQGKPKITFRTESAILEALRMPDYIDGGEYAGLMNEALANAGLPVRYTEEELEKYRTGSDPYLYPSVDWTNTVLKKHTFQSISNLSITGGNEVVTYYTNVGYTLQNGIYRQDQESPYNNNAQLKRYNFRSNVDIKVSRSLKFELGIGGVIQHGNYPGASGAAIFDALKLTAPNNFPVTNPDGSIAGAPTSYLQLNPWGLTTRSGYTRQDRNTLQGTFGTRWDLSDLVTKGLYVLGRFSYDHNYSSSTDRFKPYQIKQYLGQDAQGNDIYGDPPVREEAPMGYRLNNGANRAIYSEVSLNYNRTFNRHAFGGLLLFNRREYIDLTAGTTMANLPFRRQGLAARVTYAYNNRYLAEFNAGYNGSENFPEGKQYGFFPSVSLGWVLSNENFWKSNAITNFKIRGSYGQVGNDQIGGGRFLFLTTINRAGQNAAFGDAQRVYQGFDEALIGNPDVTWEVATKANLGFDLELYNGRVSLQVDAFNEQRTGILIQRGVIPRVTGIYPWVIPYANLGEAKNHGIDALLEVRNTNRNPNRLTYTARGTFTFARNEVVKNDDPTPRYAYQSFVGKRIDQQLGLVAIGYFRDQEDIDKSPEQRFMDRQNLKPGDIKYQDMNGDGVIDDFDRVAIGHPRTPEISFGAGGTVGYKGFELSLFFSGVANTSLFVDGTSMYPFALGLGTYNILREYYDNRWTPQTPDAKYPRASPMQNINNNRTSTLYLQDASFVRLKSAEIAYNLPLSTSQRLGIAGARVFINGMNLLTWDKIKVIDPESNYGSGGYPLQRTYNFGVQVNF